MCTAACAWLADVIFEEAPLQEVVAIFSETSTASGNVLIKQGGVGHGPMSTCEEEGSIFRETGGEWFAPQVDPT